MENKTEQNKIFEQVLQKIETGKVQIHSKNYFKLRVILLILLITAIFVISAFLCSFILFNIKITGQLSLIGFGKSGTFLFFKLFPWPLFILNISLIIITGLMIKTFRFGYKTPLIYLGLGVIIAMTLSGFLIEQTTNLHNNLWQNAQNKKLPIMGGMYRHTCASPSFKEKIYRGTIITKEKDFLTAKIQTEKCAGFSIYKIKLNTPQNTNILKTGDNIFIEGEMENGIIQAENIGTAPPLLIFQ